MSPTALHIAEAVSNYLVKPERATLLDLIAAYKTVEQANEHLRNLTGIRHFFPDDAAWDEFRRSLTRPTSSVDSLPDRQWGDVQTPARLAEQVSDYLATNGLQPRIIIEPTYGAGNFVLAVLKSFPLAKLVYGVEIQGKYEWPLKMTLLLAALRGQRFATEIELHQDDIFKHSFPDEILKSQDILIVGNPPWVTNAELGALRGKNIPAKRNVKALNGVEAILGKSNFDLAEFVLLRMLDLFSERRGALALLCKNSVIKNLVALLPQRSYKVSNVRALEIDAERDFGAAVSASLLTMELGTSNRTFSCHVSKLDVPHVMTKEFGWIRNKFVADLHAYTSNSALDGRSPLTWRQGLKHDCARIMELDVRGKIVVNGHDEVVDVEYESIFWLLKSSDLRRFEVDSARKKVIVTQHHPGEDTSYLRVAAPKLWQYLTRHAEQFEKRKSSIYRNRPPFSMFGVGDYSFKLYKVAISGLYKEPHFSLVLPIEDRPVMLDDTCYILGFDTYKEALMAASLLNSATVKQFIQSIVFSDAKRPYTKDTLMRIDLTQAALRVSFDALRTLWADMSYQPRMSIDESDYEAYKQHLATLSQVPEISQLGLGI